MNPSDNQDAVREILKPVQIPLYIMAFTVSISFVAVLKAIMFGEKAVNKFNLGSLPSSGTFATILIILTAIWFVVLVGLAIAPRVTLNQYLRIAVICSFLSFIHGAFVCSSLLWTQHMFHKVSSAQGLDWKTVVVSGGGFLLIGYGLACISMICAGQLFRAVTQSPALLQIAIGLLVLLFILWGFVNLETFSPRI